MNINMDKINMNKFKEFIKSERNEAILSYANEVLSTLEETLLNKSSNNRMN